jgi:parvulin-like peptidyl-prolyl isomerase
LVALVAVAGLAGCGGGARGNVAAPGSSAAGDTVVAEIGGVRVTKASFEHLMLAEAISREGPKAMVPDPPSYASCMARLSAGLAGSPSKLAATQLRPHCSAEYQTLRESVLQYLIASNWVIGGAAEEGVAVSAAEVERAYGTLAHQEFPSEAQLRRFTARTGRTAADVQFQLRVNLADAKIRSRLIKQAGDLSEASVAGYYRTHLQRFRVGERRDLYIIRAKTKTQAIQARRAIEAGGSFARVARRTRLQQPIGAKNGLLYGLTPNLFAEKRLNDAIFAARPGVLSGPVAISLGYYVFAVETVHPEHQESLAQVAPGLRRQLLNERRETALVDFIKRWRATWKARTSCSPGYVMRKCRQYTPPRGAPAEDPFSLN